MKPFAKLPEKKLKTMLSHGKIKARRLTQAQRGAIGARLGEKRRGR